MDCQFGRWPISTACIGARCARRWSRPCRRRVRLLSGWRLGWSRRSRRRSIPCCAVTWMRPGSNGTRREGSWRGWWTSMARPRQLVHNGSGVEAGYQNQGAPEAHRDVEQRWKAHDRSTLGSWSAFWPGASGYLIGVLVVVGHKALLATFEHVQRIGDVGPVALVKEELALGKRSRRSRSRGLLAVLAKEVGVRVRWVHRDRCRRPRRTGRSSTSPCQPAEAKSP